MDQPRKEKRERAYMVMSVDELDDARLYATDDLARAEAEFERVRRFCREVRANWRDVAQ